MLSVLQLEIKSQNKCHVLTQFANVDTFLTLKKKRRYLTMICFVFSELVPRQEIRGRVCRTVEEATEEADTQV